MAQVGTNYGLINTTGTYADISGGTDVNAIEANDAISGDLPIGFTFLFDGVNYTVCRASSNGWLSLGSTATGSLPANNLTSSTPGRPFIAPLWDDLSGAPGLFGLGRGVAKYQTTGAVGSRIVHMQWREWKWDRNMTTEFNTVSFSCKLYETTNVIEFNYQQELVGPTNNSGGASIGVSSVATGANNFLSLNNTGASPTASGTVETSNLSGRPATDQVYRIVPCKPPTLSTSTLTNCATSNYTVSVNVSNLGSAPSVDLVSSVGGVFANDVGVGTYTSPALANGTAQTISVVHNGNSLCNLPLGNFNSTGNCVTNGACLTPTLTIPTDGCGSNSLDASIPITFPGTALGNDVLLESVDLIIQATLFNNSDFEVRLVSPTGQSRNLVINRFGSGSNIGNPATCPSAFLRLIDGGTPLTNTNTNNVTGNYAPEQTLAGFTGNPNGQWTLRLCDEGILIAGALKFARLNFVILGSSDPCDPRLIACGQGLTPNSTAGYPNTLPPSACAFNGAASTGGVHWWGHTAAASGEITASLCGTANFNTRLSVFRATPDCSNLTCVAMSDDGPGCPGNSSILRFLASAGETYLFAVHGAGAAAGTYTIGLFCQPACTPAAANDLCPVALPVLSALADGSTPPLAQDNTCAHVDGPTSVSGPAPVVGLWYTFNAGDHARHRLRLITNAPGYTATQMGYALYSGTCSALSATGELAGSNAAGQFTDLPLLTPDGDYRLLLYNNGSITQAGSFAMLVDHPGMHDAGVTAVSAPTGVVCGNMVGPVVTLKNFGEADLTSVILRVTIDGGASILDHPWVGTLAYGATTTVNLPAVLTPLGLHALEVAAVSPNGQPDEIAANDQSSTNYDASGQPVKVVVHTDGAGSDITWTIYDAFFFPLVNGGSYGNNTTYESTHCLATTLGECYTFYLFDSSGDGLCCGNGDGYWQIRDGANRLLVGDQFLASVDGSQSPAINTASPLYVGHEFCLPGGPSNIVANECGIFNNTLNNKVYCTAVQGVLSYQFEFSDPDAGFLRRIALPRPWVKFGEMVTVPLQPGVRYFTRVRVDQGASGFADDRFGGGCDMGIDPAQVPGCTQLIDNPNLNTHSCGVTKAFGGSDKIWAQPVLGGTAYRFQFSNPGEGYNRVMPSNNYVCVLHWDTLPLVNGSTYDVRVSVLVNGQWSGYCGAACALTILNLPGMSQEGRAVTASRHDGISLYPNPVTQDRVSIRIDGLTDEHQEVLVEVYSITGERVVFQRFANEGDLINRTLEVPPSLNAGTYLVRVNVNGEVSTHKLNIVR